MPVPMLLRSAWPTPVADGYGRAFDFHLTGLARWLNRAGAEPRLALVLCSGAAARAQFVSSIGIDRIEVVQTPARREVPVDPRITAHQGSHFNNTLFVVDGLDPDAPGLFEALDGRAGMLDRTATWVTLVVESLAALEALYTRAPRLAGRIMRRCLVLDAHAADSDAAPVDGRLLERWRGPAHIAERIYHHAMTPKHAPEPLAFDRMARTGYLPALVGRVMHPERQRLCSLWRGGRDVRALPFAVEQAGPAAAEAALRRAPKAFDAASRQAALAGLDPRACLAVEGPLPAGTLADLRAVGAMGEGRVALDAKVVERLRRAVPTLDPDVAAHAHQALAAAAAAAGDLDGCADALGSMRTSAEAAGLPEVMFDALEKQMQVAIFSDRRGEAKSLLQALEALAPTLHSPFYAGRAKLARGEFVAPLDPARATVELKEAERLFRAHGHPTWAESAAENLP